MPELGVLLAAADFVPAPEHAPISQLALDEPRVFEAAGVGMLSRRRDRAGCSAPAGMQTDLACPGEPVPLRAFRGGYSVRADRAEAATRQHWAAADSAPLPGSAVLHDALPHGPQKSDPPRRSLMPNREL